MSELLNDAFYISFARFDFFFLEHGNGAQDWNDRHPMGPNGK